MAVVHGCLPDRQLNGSLHDQYTGPGILTQIQTAVDMNATNRSLKYFTVSVSYWQPSTNNKSINDHQI
ncbi:hypothetical protein DERF_005456 [Dermatophagoides farinae]|uniref:Uncharacterized protein n=1 Tax=Dermatophagoides farinae TaxID=6954 RepID=A0A922LB99_DERFA|nr:hypothetical protein DERF_005456 [Dermatophagoides farinae]